MKILPMSLLSAWALFAAPPPSMIAVRFNTPTDVFVAGEGCRGTIDVANSSADRLDVGRAGSPDRLFVELFRASDRMQYACTAERPFTVPFALNSGEGLKLETVLSDHYAFPDDSRYFARAVLVHDGMRYESSLKSFDVVPGLPMGGAVQMFKDSPKMKRMFELVYWTRAGVEHLFLKARDQGAQERVWRTSDLGPVLRVTQPRISVLPTGEVIVLHRTTQSAFIRSEFWSLSDAFEFHEHELMTDPDMVGAERVKALYRESGTSVPVKKAWWKFW